MGRCTTDTTQLNRKLFQLSEQSNVDQGFLIMRLGRWLERRAKHVFREYWPPLFFSVEYVRYVQIVITTFHRMLLAHW